MHKIIVYREQLGPGGEIQIGEEAEELNRVTLTGVGSGEVKHGNSSTS